jgi:glucose/arabinose dehydrogenase
MRNILFICSAVILIGSIGLWTAHRFGIFSPHPLNPGESRIILTNQQTPPPNSSPVPYTYESYVENLVVPWSMVFTDPDRILVTERAGRIRVIQNGLLQPEPLITFTEISHQDEEGLMGMALDPDYDQNKYIYVCLAYPDKGTLKDKVVRLIDTHDSISVDRIVLDDIPAAKYHAGCRLKFGPDNNLYITTGDATDKQIAQDIDSLGGKILRIHTDGSIPEDNPFPDSPVYSYGHRNPQGIDWHPLNDQLYSSEHGPTIFDGPAGGDEINRIVAGGNYGWPRVSHNDNEPGLIAPLTTFTPAEAPSGGMFYSDTVFPQFTNDFFVGALKGEGILRISLSESDPDQIIMVEKLPIEVGRIREIVQGPDGFIYFATSNRDGRGSAISGDDHIYRIIPIKS